jgi:hypothetical protein
MARELLGIATGAESEAVKLAAVKDALDRAGLGAKAALELSVAEPKPWEHIMGDVAGVANITREESRARRGIAEPALDDETLDIVEAELVDVGPEMPPSSTEETRTPAEQADLPDHTSAPPTGPPSRELATLDEATHDAAQANRRAKALRVR